jgi:uncharacterized membrane protein YqjE
MDAARNAIHAAAQPSADGSVRSGGSPRQAEPPPLEHALGRLWDDLQGLLHDQLLLASLESRQALAGLVRILVLAVTCAALLLGAWGAAMAAVVMWLLDTGLSPALVLAVVVGGTLLLTAGLFWLARQSVGELTFPATLRRLANAPPLRSPE